MANIKFSAFTVETDIANFDDIVGYQGVVNKKITPANLASSLVTLSGGPYLPIVAGAGNPLTGDLYIGDGTAAKMQLLFVTSGAAGDEVEINSQGKQFLLHELGTDMKLGPSDEILFDDSGTQLITMTQNTYFQADILDSTNSAGTSDEILTSLGPGSGTLWADNTNIEGIGYKAVQAYVWTNGAPVAYVNWGSAVASDLPFDATPLINQNNLPASVSVLDYTWTCANAAGGTAGQEATFTLGASGDGTWKVRTCQHWFDQTNQVEIRVSFDINGTLIDVIDEKSTEFTGDKIFYGELIQTFSAGDTLQVNVEFTVGGITPFPSDAGNRPIEITFERLI